MSFTSTFTRLVRRNQDAEPRRAKSAGTRPSARVHGVSASRVARVSVAIACVALVGVAAQVRLVFMGNTQQQQLRVCCENYSAVINAVGSHLTGEWEPFGAPQRIVTAAAKTTRSSSPADPDATAQDWWDVTQIVCRASAVVYRADETQPPRGTVELYPRAPVHDRDTKPVPSAPARDAPNSAPSDTDDGVRAALRAVPVTTNTIATTGDYLVTLFAAALQSIPVPVSVWPATPEGANRVHAFRFDAFAVTSVLPQRTQSTGRSVSVRVAMTGAFAKEYTASMPCVDASCEIDPRSSWSMCCVGQSWAPTLAFTVAYTCDATGAHGFHAVTSDFAADFPSTDNALRSGTLNPRLSALSVPKPHDAPLCPPV